MKFAPRRAAIIWFGILVMASVAWAWWDSMATLSTVSRGPWSIAHAQSEISLTYREERRGTPFHSLRFPLPVVRGPGFPAPGFQMKGGGIHREVMLSLPHALVFLALAVTWMAILWQRPAKSL